MQRRHAQHQPLGRGHEIIQTVASRQRQVVFAEILTQRFTPSAGFRANHHTVLALRKKGAKIRERVIQTTVDRNIRQWGREFRGFRFCLQHPATEGFEQREEIFIA